MTLSTTAHPFGGGIPYPWDRAEAQALFDALSRDVTDPGEIDQAARTFAPQAARLNLQLAVAELWRTTLLDISLADQLVQFCTRLAEDESRLLLSRAARAVLDARPAVERRLGRNGRLVVDREELRAYLSELALEDSPVKVVLVRGRPHTGKSWSRHLFEQAARDRGAKPVYLRAGMVATVKQVLIKIYSELGAAQRLPDVDTTLAAGYQDICLLLPGVAEQAGRPMWIAMDDLGPDADGQPQLDPEIRKFFDQFALTLEDPSASRWFRLLLIHYPDGQEVPARWGDDVWKEDRTRPEVVTEAHVAEVLLEWGAERDQRQHEDEIVAVSQQVISRADAALAPEDPRSQHPRLRRIHDELQAELDRLGGASP
jgi:hypothetical protein